MAKNYVSEGRKLTLIAPAGGVKSGQLVKIGDLIGVSQFDAVAGDRFVMAVSGIYKDLVKRSHASEEAIAVGDSLFWDSDGNAAGDGPALSKVSTSNGNAIGVAVEASATTNTTVTCLLRGMAV
ncbi:MAG: DUF2190 family protein [Paracoccaceae bacterium]|nr:DUF2190 family protein [Paracoccaceae bacterium]